MSEQDHYVFPRWTNYVVPAVVFAVFGGLPYVPMLLGFLASPATINRGYQPHQPIGYSHELHVNQLGLDCRYCHTTVQKAAFAAIPPTETCMNCHDKIHTGSKELEPLRASFRTGRPIRWTKVHKLGEYAFFNHSAHLSKGVSCVSCHGRVDQMDGAEHRVHQVKDLSMGWCLKCHRNPAPNLRPLEDVFDLRWGDNLTDPQIARIEALDVGIKSDALTERKLTDEQREKIGEKLLENVYLQRLGLTLDKKLTLQHVAQLKRVEVTQKSFGFKYHAGQTLDPEKQKIVRASVVAQQKGVWAAQMSDCSKCHR
jgi:hypothetical protein